MFLFLSMPQVIEQSLFLFDVHTVAVADAFTAVLAAAPFFGTNDPVQCSTHGFRETRS